jgi:alpha-tubulin suppressor-like RCC1 family protein
VYCWGWNPALGFEDSSGGVFTPRQYASAGQASVATGLSFSCSVGNDLTAACWGSNDRGQLGTGTTALRSTTPLKVSNGSNAKDVAGGFYSACLLKADGTVWCWGANNNNQIGNTCSQVSCSVSPGGVAFVRSPVQVQQLVDAKQMDGGGETMCALRADNSVACWGRNDRGQLGSGFLGGSSATPVRVIWK